MASARAIGFGAGPALSTSRADAATDPAREFDVVVLGAIRCGSDPSLPRFSPARRGVRSVQPRSREARR